MTDKRANVVVDASQNQGELSHNWTYIGYDEINYTYTPEGKALLGKFGDLQDQPYYVRAHHLLCTGNCHGFYKWGSTNAYLEDEAGNPGYDWTFVDLVFDTLLENHCKPFVELGFMPQDLVDAERYDSEKNQTYRTYGWACPPKDYDKWYELIFRLVEHCKARYGQQEIASWYWELWNEPDLDYYWKGSLDEFNKLYDYTVAAVKAACPEARVGGPGTTNPVHGNKSAQYLDGFLKHCASGTNYYTGQKGTPLDFVSFHVKGGGYRADPLHRKQNPPSVKQILSHTQNGYEIISRYPGFKELECVLSEIDPDGWAAGGAWDNANLNFRNTEYYPSFVATAFHKVSRFAKEKNWDLKLLSWAFLFVGERCFEGTRSFSTQGIDKAIFNLFKIYAQMGAQQVSLESSLAKNPLAYSDLWGKGETADIAGMATLADERLAILLYNHHDNWDDAGQYEIELEIKHLPFKKQLLSLKHYRIDATHSNAYAEWLRQAKPMYPSAEQADTMKEKSGLELLEPPQTLTLHKGGLVLTFTMPVHSLSLLLVE
ncbi:MAG: hypothetical protein KC422_09335 [Trueperaceae bacterium]|nr:hypothetical protein [Trueperaceae bacterium]